jgi:hypothetical protein
MGCARLFLLYLPVIAFAQTTRADFYVSPAGNDGWSGTLAAPNAQHSDGPFASVARAQAQLRESIKAKPNQPHSVLLRGGTYYLPLSANSPGTLSFTAEDSGAAGYPVSWRGYPGETPAISGGEPAGKGGLGLTWKNVSGSLWRVQLPAATKPFETLYYNGERRLRSRVRPGEYLRVAEEVPAKGENGGCPAIAKASKPSVAKCLDRFVYDPKDPIVKWANLNPSDTACPAAQDGSPEKNFPAGDIEVTLFNAETVDVLRVSCVDTARHMIYFTANARGDSVRYDSFGPSAGRRYIVENTKDAFDAGMRAGQTGIWFLDRSTVPWMLNYLARPGENPNRDTVTIPQVQPVSPAGGSLISGVYLDYVTFAGIAFEADNYVPPPTGFNSDETGSATLPEAIDCVSCKHIVFDSVTVRNTSASGIRFTSGSSDIDVVPTDLRIVNSVFYDIGASGVRIGSHPRVGDRWNHVVQYVTVENTIVQGYGRVFAGGSGIALSNGHDATFVHNDITDGYHSGISVCLNGCGAHDGDGYEIVTRYNHIWNVMQGVTSDGGGVYYNVGDRAGSGIEDTVLNNLIHDVAGYGGGGRGIFLDNRSAAMEVMDNVVFRADVSMELPGTPLEGARENVAGNNILVSVAEPTGAVSPEKNVVVHGERAGRVDSAKEAAQLEPGPAGFDSNKINDTIRQAGRVRAAATPPKVPATFPTAGFGSR